MTLDPEYLRYPHRRKGMDHDLYRYSSLFEREPIRWPGERAVAVPIVVSLEWFPILPMDKPFRAPGHMQTTYPDYRHYTSREYGTRVGFYRLLDAFGAAGVRVSVATNSSIAERYPSIVRDIVAAGHEIVAHSTDMNGTIATGLDPADERLLIKTSLDVLERVSGKRPTAWLSIGRSQSWNTPHLLAEAKVDVMLDWVNDELPYAVQTRAGTIVNLPLNHELSDRQIINVQQHSAGSYAQQIRDAFDWLAGEAGAGGGGRVLPVHVTPYILGLPYRIGAFEKLLGWLTGRTEAWFATVSEVADAAKVA